MLQVSLLGEPRLNYRGERDAPRASDSVVSLLAYLLLHRGAALKRTAVAFALWPDLAESRALARLRRFLFQLQAVLPRTAIPWVVADKTTIRWNADALIWFDVAEFERLAADPATAADAVELYRGDFLTGVDEEWLESPRTRLSELQSSKLLALMTAAREGGELRTALAYAQRLLAADAWREDVIRAVITLRHEMGDRAGALQAYRDFAERLERDMAVEPMSETRAAYDRVVAQDDANAVPVRGNLPSSTTSFVGRGGEIQSVATLLRGDEHRIVTITGTGGVGKSRLALEIARTVRTSFPDGVWFVELVSVADGASIPSTILRTMGIVERGELGAEESLARGLESAEALIVLDNCEHVIDAAARAAELLARRCPLVRILATSRERLRIDGEATYALAPLAVPSEQICSRDEALTFGAVDLFARRAATLGPGVFDLTDANAAIVADIVRRLDGIPLAIELAVPKLRLLDAAQLAMRLSDRFELLVGGTRNAVPRHQTLRALIDWSYEALTAAERSVLQRLCVFAGSFDIDAAVAVCSDADLPETQVIQLLAALIDKSLVVVAGDAMRRYGLLDSIREYGLERLRSGCGDHESRRKHVALYLVRAQAAGRAEEFDKERHVQAMRHDRRNFYAALSWSLDEAGDPELGAQLLVAVSPFFEHDDPFHFMRRLCGRALDMLGPTGSPLLVADVRMRREVFSRYTAYTEDRVASIEVAVAICREARSSRALSGALGYLANALSKLGRHDRARDAAEESVALSRTLDDPKRLAWSLRLNALVLGREARDERVALLTESLDVYAPADSNAEAGIAWSYMSEAEFHAGNVADARRCGLTAMRIFGETPTLFKRQQATCLTNLATYHAVLGSFDDAREAAREALTMSDELGATMTTLFAVQQQGLLSTLLGDAACGARLLGFCDARLTALAITRTDTESIAHARLLDELRSTFAPDELDALMRDGASWNDARAFAIALAV